MTGRTVINWQRPLRVVLWLLAAALALYVALELSAIAAVAFIAARSCSP